MLAGTGLGIEDYLAVKSLRTGLFILRATKMGNCCMYVHCTVQAGTAAVVQCNQRCLPLSNLCKPSPPNEGASDGHTLKPIRRARRRGRRRSPRRSPAPQSGCPAVTEHVTAFLSFEPRGRKRFPATPRKVAQKLLGAARGGGDSGPAVKECQARDAALPMAIRRTSGG